MSVLIFAAMLAALFATCRWSGHTLAGHYQDGWEIAAIGAMSAGVFGALWTTRALGQGYGAVPLLCVVVAGAAGLLLGYVRDERVS